MVTLLVNGNAGSIRDDDAKDRLQHLVHSTLDDANLVFMDGESDVTDLARDAVAKGSRMVVAGGGDGTLGSVAAALAGGEVPMGILPLGTLNHFARDVGIPLEVEDAVKVLAEGRTITVDYARVNDELFLNNSGLGLYPAIVRLREIKQRTGLAKWPAAALATVRALARYERLGIRVSVNGQLMLRRTPMVFVGNNEYLFDGSGLPARERLDEGQLCIYIPKVQGRFRLIWFAVRALFGRPRAGEDYDHFLATECAIETRHSRIRISLDGEVTVVKPPLQYRVTPGGLRVRVPQPAVEAPA